MKRPPAPRHPATTSVTDLLASDFARRKFDRELLACEAALRVLCFCRYRRAPEHLSYVRPAARHDALGFRRGPSSCFVLDLASPMRWCEEVYSRGLACASGCFVFAVAEGLPGGALVVLAARQGRGCTLRLAHAAARRERGAWVLDRRRLPESYMSPPAPQPSDPNGYYARARGRKQPGQRRSALSNSPRSKSRAVDPLRMRRPRAGRS